MNRLTTRSRKVVYLLGVLVLLVPIVLLGMPASQGSTTQGHLASLRTRYDLGEPDLGDVDPTSATMNPVLLGLRGVAANLLWLDATEQQGTKNWARLRADVESIILLQPHFKEVWRHHGWNLAYNVSVEWDAVEDRYYWVKEGGKFLMQGSQTNQTYPELYWETGRILGDKIGYSDEWRIFRKFFVSDPDTENYEGGTDPELNPFGRDDNYLAAKDKFIEANEVEAVHGQHMMMQVLFRQWPARSQISYAQALQREGNFGEVARFAWKDAYTDWIDKLGQESFPTSVGEVRLAATNRDIQQWADEREGVSVDEIRSMLNSMWNVTHYHYWAVRTLADAQEVTMAAHREIFRGRQLFKQAKMIEACAVIESGLEKFERVLQQYPQLQNEDNAVEEVMTAMLYWRYAMQVRGVPFPESYPLKQLWEDNQSQLPLLVEDFRTENGL